MPPPPAATIPEEEEKQEVSEPPEKEEAETEPEEQEREPESEPELETTLGIPKVPAEGYYNKVEGVTSLQKVVCYFSIYFVDQSSPTHTSTTVLTQHVSFWDRKKKGVFYPWDTYNGCRALGFNSIFSLSYALAFHLLHASYWTSVRGGAREIYVYHTPYTLSCPHSHTHPTERLLGSSTHSCLSTSTASIAPNMAVTLARMTTMAISASRRWRRISRNMTSKQDVAFSFFDYNYCLTTLTYTHTTSIGKGTRKMHLRMVTCFA